MTNPLLLLAIAAAVVAGVSVLLARLIPDEYDRLELEPVRTRR
jgi:hypothetical protein